MMISKKIFLEEVRKRKGLIPASIDIAAQSITWRDFGKYHFYEGFFSQSLRYFEALSKGDIFSCTTHLDVLEDDYLLDDTIHPSGFIFHSGRCGSTLMSKVLATSKKNVVISESEPHNDILHLLANSEGKIDCTEKNKKIYRNLVLAMGRKRSENYQHHFIKFTSYNILFFDFIHAALPDVPAIFISRDTEEIMQSFHKNPPGWLNTENEFLQRITNSTDARKIIEKFISSATLYDNELLHKVDYKMLRAEHLPQLLQYLKYSPDAGEIETMKKQFLFDSKTGKIFGE
ncbi:MAG: hypothetical protein ACKOXB_06260 [Flavobacteriales bacterium]